MLDLSFLLSIFDKYPLETNLCRRLVVSVGSHLYTQGTALDRLQLSTESQAHSAGAGIHPRTNTSRPL